MIGKYLSKKARNINSSVNRGVKTVRNVGITYISFRVVKFFFGAPIGFITGIVVFGTLNK